MIHGICFDLFSPKLPGAYLLEVQGQLPFLYGFVDRVLIKTEPGI